MNIIRLGDIKVMHCLCTTLHSTLKLTLHFFTSVILLMPWYRKSSARDCSHPFLWSIFMLRVHSTSSILEAKRRSEVWGNELSLSTKTSVSSTSAASFLCELTQQSKGITPSEYQSINISHVPKKGVCCNALAQLALAWDAWENQTANRIEGISLPAYDDTNSFVKFFHRKSTILLL